METINSQKKPLWFDPIPAMQDEALHAIKEIQDAEEVSPAAAGEAILRAEALQTRLSKEINDLATVWELNVTERDAMCGLMSSFSHIINVYHSRIKEIAT